ncbi:hypothetical protein GCM10007981_17330 [Thermocladium modestius]|uniref:AAA domain-containing protein n=1 Tax=Thermocladium modestius TaxID=62609 RepID=A0A830H0J0_9CREN|nr:hypothetical protein [Thermocladium modestius]GGP22205.1 hypothetical protein GCM10007981_17330 [Thermocladium modestius]
MRKLKFGIDYPMTLLLGIRRSGKSSLVKVLAKQEDAIWIYLDLRKFDTSTYINYKDLLQELERGINAFLPSKLKKAFTALRGVSLMGVNIRFSWGKERVEFSQILDKLSEVGEKEGKKGSVNLR